MALLREERRAVEQQPQRCVGVGVGLVDEARARVDGPERRRLRPVVAREFELVVREGDAAVRQIRGLLGAEREPCALPLGRCCGGGGASLLLVHGGLEARRVHLVARRGGIGDFGVSGGG